jgi:hypothetical protein
MPPAGSSREKVAHGSILSDSFSGRRVNSQWQSTAMQHDDKRAVLREILRDINVSTQRSGVRPEIFEDGETIVCI